MVKTQQARNSFPQLDKEIYKRPTGNIIHNCEKIDGFPLRTATRQEHPLSLLLFNIVLYFPADAIRQEKEIKGKQIRKKNYL